MAPRQIRPIRVEGNVAYVPLTKGYEAIVDVVDIPKVDSWNWTAQVEKHTVYAYRMMRINGSSKNVYMHRQIHQADDAEVDHINGNGLDNQRSNLRTATSAQNKQSRRIAKAGATFVKRLGKWQAQIKANGKAHYLGLFSTQAEAQKAYNAACASLHAEYGRQA